MATYNVNMQHICTASAQVMFNMLDYFKVKARKYLHN